MTQSWAMAYVSFLLLVLLLDFIIFPLIFQIHCFASGFLERGKKSLWVILMFLLWPIPNFMYAYAHAQSQACRRMATAGILLLVAALVATAVILFQVVGIAHIGEIQQLHFPKTPASLRHTLHLNSPDDVSALTRKMEKTDLSALTLAERDQLQFILGSLQLELQDEKMSKERKQQIGNVLNRLRDDFSDKILTRDEYFAWLQQASPTAPAIAPGKAPPAVRPQSAKPERQMPFSDLHH